MRDFFQKEISTGSARRWVRVAAALAKGISIGRGRLKYAPFDRGEPAREFEHVVTRAIGWPGCDDLIVVANVCW